MGIADADDADEIPYGLSLWGCMQIVMADYGIKHNLTPKMGEHFVEDFMALLCKRGFAERVPDKDEEKKDV